MNYSYEELKEAQDYGNFIGGLMTNSGMNYPPDNYRYTSTGEDKEHIDKLINDHWDYVEGILYAAILHEEATEEEVERIREIEYHYKSSGKHFWKHACEYYGVGDV